MGREIRRVPPNWKHPVNNPCPHYPRNCAYGPEKVCYHPVFNQYYGDSAEEWLEELREFTPNETDQYYWDYAGNPPDKDYYLSEKWTPEQATAWVAYETVSEGTPVTPVFENPEELIDYLVEHGDYWDQRRGHGGWPRQNAEDFVKRGGWRPSMIAVPGKGLLEPKDMGPEEFKRSDDAC